MPTHTACIVANLNSLSFDYVVRQKIQGTTLNWYIVEQLARSSRRRNYDRKFGDTTASEIVRDHVLRLTYTAYDMRPFARDLGYDGEPFTPGTMRSVDTCGLGSMRCTSTCTV